MLTIPQNPALLSMVHGKLDGLVGKDSGYIASLPAAVKRRIEGLKGIQAEHSKIENEFQLAILEVEKKVRCFLAGKHWLTLSVPPKVHPSVRASFGYHL